MRKAKILILATVEIEDDFTDQDMADVYSQALQTVNETFIHEVVLYEQRPSDMLEEILDDVKTDYQRIDFYGTR